MWDILITFVVLTLLKSIIVISVQESNKCDISLTLLVVISLKLIDVKDEHTSNKCDIFMTFSILRPFKDNSEI